MKKDDIEKLEVNQLIHELQTIYNAKDLKELCNMIGKINYTTFLGWQRKNEISEKGNSREFLETLLLLKFKEQELEIYKNLGRALTQIQDLSKDN